jgi:hypothetical protein
VECHPLIPPDAKPRSVCRHLDVKMSRIGIDQAVEGKSAHTGEAATDLPGSEHRWLRSMKGEPPLSYPDDSAVPRCHDDEIRVDSEPDEFAKGCDPESLKRGQQLVHLATLPDSPMSIGKIPPEMQNVRIPAIG